MIRKFNIGQQVYYFEWSDILDGFYIREGKIDGIYHNKVDQVLYKINGKLYLPSLLYDTKVKAEQILKEELK